MYKKIISLIFSALLIVQISSCGTLFYPDRRGQTHGKIDTDVVLLDGIGLLFYIIPGLIAFAIDYKTGTIYKNPTSVNLNINNSN